mgnify:FL=1
MQILRSVCLVVIIFWTLGAHAQNRPMDPQWPVKPIKMLLGYPPGGGSDIVARLIARGLTDRLGQNVLVENHPGAGGIIATDMAAKASPDGYTLFFVPSGHASIAALRRKGLTFDPVNDFTWISTVTTYPLALTVAPDSKFKN